jgi:peptide/nickel transport system permease protein
MGEPRRVGAVSRFRRFVRALGVSGWVGTLIIAVFVVAALAAPQLAPHDPTEQVLSLRRAPPTLAHPFGHDEFGRDILSRTLYGARVALLVGASSVVSGGLVGVLLGTTAGYLRGSVDEIIMRLMDVALAFPYLVLALAIVGILGPGLRNTTLAIGIWIIPGFARIVRGCVLSVRENDYIEAAVSTGAGHLRVVVRHVGPNVVSPVLVYAAICFANAVLMESSFSFLGLGVPPPTPSWGSMISSGRDSLRVAPHIVAFPSLVLAGTVLGLNLLADGVRDAMDPRTMGQRFSE